MLVSDLLRRKGAFVATIAPDATVDALIDALAEHNVGALVVSSDGTSLHGVVSERDVVRALAGQTDDLLGTPVEGIMTSDVTTATAEDSLEEVMRLMTDQHVRHIPILADGRVVGIISIGDVVKARMDELESERENLIGYIRSG